MTTYIYTFIFQKYIKIIFFYKNILVFSSINNCMEERSIKKKKKVINPIGLIHKKTQSIYNKKFSYNNPAKIQDLSNQP